MINLRQCSSLSTVSVSVRSGGHTVASMRWRSHAQKAEEFRYIERWGTTIQRTAVFTPNLHQTTL